MDRTDAHLASGLAAEDGSTRLRTALALGAVPDPRLVDLLIARCAVEPDFFVRDMLTWALTRLPATLTVPKLMAELQSELPQARSQALHTLSKIKDASVFPAITQSLLRDSNDDVARSAWRAAVILVPEGQKPLLAEELVAQLGRGEREVQLSLSRAIVALGRDAVEPLLQRAATSTVPEVRAHALATERLLNDPDAGVSLAIAEAKRQYALKNRPA